MRNSVLLTTITLVLLSLSASSDASMSTAASIGPISSATVQGLNRFSSAYTGLTKCGSGMTKKEEKEAEAQGSDIPTRCKGLGGYSVYIYYSACSSNFSLE
jgi:hypothetical protein